MPRTAPTPFQRVVHDVLAALEPGQVVSYGWVAQETGSPTAARAVGGYLGSCLDAPHWWRVVAVDGTLVAPHADEQAWRLRGEGHRVEDGRVLTSVARPEVRR